MDEYSLEDTIKEIRIKIRKKLLKTITECSNYIYEKELRMPVAKEKQIMEEEFHTSLAHYFDRIQ